jgi:hypothetical protein
VIYLTNNIDEVFENVEKYYQDIKTYGPLSMGEQTLIDFVDLINKYEDTEFLKKRYENTQTIYDFWEEFKKNDDKKEDICDTSIEELRKRHANVINLIGKHDYTKVGLLLAGKYYKNVWESRSCSSRLSKLMYHDNYLDFYCSSSTYYFLMTSYTDDKLIKDFDEAIKLDGYKINGHGVI